MGLHSETELQGPKTKLNEVHTHVGTHVSTHVRTQQSTIFSQVVDRARSVKSIRVNCDAAVLVVMV